MISWKQYIEQLSLPDKDISFDFNTPASDNSLQDLKNQLALEKLPAELEELYLQTDGIDEKINDEKTGELIWPVQRVIETNKEYRSYPDFKNLYLPFDQLLLFSDAGNGDLFAFVILNGKFDSNDIFVWNHENDSRTWVAPDLEKFIDWWTTGTLKV